jgi:pimeloyl-ACP methyl ester carboxylesterase
MLGPRAPTTRSEVYTWARPYVPRIVALVILGTFGIHAFDDLPVLAFAIPADKEAAAHLTAIYSFRLMSAFGTTDYAGDLRDARCPLAVIVGGDDELFAGDQFATTVHAERPDVPVTVIPGLGHVAMMVDRRALDAVIAAIQKPEG